MSLIGADQFGEPRAGGMAHDQNPLRIVGRLGEVVVYAADGLGGVTHDGHPLDARQESVVGGVEDESLRDKTLRLELNAGLVASQPQPPSQLSRSNGGDVQS